MPTIKPVAITDNTPDGARAFLQKVQRDVREMFRRRGEIRPVAFMVGDRNPDTSAMLDEPATTFALIDPEFMADNDTKNKLSTVLHEMAVAAGAFGLALVTEMWIRSFRHTDPGRARAAMEEFQATGTSLNDDSQAGLREEGVLLAYEHYALPGESKKVSGRLQSYVMWAKILRPGRGRPRLGPWEDPGAPGFESRFAGLLPDGDYLDRAAQALDQLRGFAKELKMTQAHAAEVVSRGRYHEPGMPPPKWLAQRLREMEW